jgi:hypothetical protein
MWQPRLAAKRSFAFNATQAEPTLNEGHLMDVYLLLVGDDVKSMLLYSY